MNKLDKCYDIGNTIIEKYIELISFSVFWGANNQNKELINEIKKLITEEYELYSTMNIDEINLYIKLLSNESLYDDSSTVSRMQNKLENFSEIHNNRFFSGKELGREDFFGDMKFSIYDIMISIINIDAIKSIKSKIYSLTANTNKDRIFIDELKFRLELSKSELLFSLSTSEMIALCSNANIDEINNFNVSKLNSLLQKHECADNYLKAAYYNTAVVYMKNILDKLSVIYTVGDDAKDVFYYLSLITRIEIIISNMNIDTLSTIYNYCCEITNDSNENSMLIVKRLIKEKL